MKDFGVSEVRVDKPILDKALAKQIPGVRVACYRTIPSGIWCRVKIQRTRII